MNEQQEINEEMKRLLLRTLLTGFIGGLLLGFSWVMFSYFNFVEFSPRSLLLGKWKTSNWAKGWIGNSITIVGISMFSIIISLLYYVSLKKINSIWIGVAFGIVIWSISFFVIGKLFPLWKVSKLESETTISTLSLFVLYGTFIGYSISYDFYRIQFDSMFGKERVANSKSTQ